MMNDDWKRMLHWKFQWVMLVSDPKALSSHENQRETLIQAVLICSETIFLKEVPGFYIFVDQPGEKQWENMNQQTENERIMGDQKWVMLYLAIRCHRYSQQILNINLWLLLQTGERITSLAINSKMVFHWVLTIIPGQWFSVWVSSCMLLNQNWEQNLWWSPYGLQTISVRMFLFDELVVDLHNQQGIASFGCSHQRETCSVFQ